jgi:hypothetical protein
VSLNEQCGTFPSLTTIDIDCVLCICYNGLFTCEIQPTGLCRKSTDFIFDDLHTTSINRGQTSHVPLTRTMRIERVLQIIQHRFRNIRAFEPMTRWNVSFDDRQLAQLSGYRIILNHSSSSCLASMMLLLFNVVCHQLFV